MQPIRRPRHTRALIAVTIIMPLLLTGCSVIQPAPNATPTKTAAVKSTLLKTGTTLGDAVASGKTVTDTHGKYETVVINPASSALTFNPTQVNTVPGKKAVFTDTQLAAAQKWLMLFIASQALDSVAVDNGKAGWDQWVQDDAPKYLDPKFSKAVLDNIRPISDRSEVILNDTKNSYPQLVRDGGPRVASEQIKIASITPAIISGKEKTDAVMFSGNASAVYRATNKDIIRAVMRQAPGLSEKTIKSSYPNLADGKEGTVQVQATLMYVYTLTLTDAGWRIAAINNRTSFSYLNLTS